MELIFYYAKNYENKPAQYHNLSNEWIVNYDEEKGTLVLHQNQEYIKDFYGENIASLTAIIGNNGAGKTTILNNISRTVLSENDTDQIGHFVFLAVYLKEKKLFCYNFGNVMPIKKVKGITFVNANTWAEDLKSVLTIFFSQHIEPLYSGNFFIKRKELPNSGRKDISTAYLYYQTVINNVSEINQVEKIFRKEDYRKYIKLFKNVKLKISLETPDFINVTLLKRFYDFKEYQKIYIVWPLKELSDLLYDIRKTTLKDIAQREIIEQAVFQVISKYQSVKLDDKLDFFLKGLKDIIVKLNGNGFYTYEEIAEEIMAICPTKYHSYMQDSIKLINYLEKGDKSYLQINHNGFTIDMKSNSATQVLTQMNEAGLIDTELNFIQIGFSHNKLDYTTLSSGEYALWSLFSRIYHLKNKLKKHNILLLDEAELNLHPKWQREFVNTLLDFLNSNFKNTQFQIVLSSHSPLILSDLPKSAISYLSSDEFHNDDLLPQTFGANIHELYSSGFGLNGNLIGGFASNKITKIVNELFEMNTISREDAEKYLKTIKLIGEPFIKSKLIERIEALLSSNEIDFVIKLKEEEIRQKEIELINLRSKKSKGKSK